LLGPAEKGIAMSRPARLLALVLVLACHTPPGTGGRTTLELDEGWKFFPGDPAPAEGQAGWSDVRVPHTWNAVDGQDGGNDYRRGPGWYRRHVRVPELAGRRWFLQFDAASIVAQVWVNGVAVGQHRGAFARFRLDVTDLVRAGEDNLIAVRVDNAPDGDVPPLAGDFTLFGGLHRKVSLLATDAVHLDLLDHGSSGVYLTASEVSVASARLSAKVLVANDDERERQAPVRVVVADRQGRVVATWIERQTLAAGARAAVMLAGTIDHPHLWNGRVDPYLYDVTVQVGDSDAVTVPFGLRSFAVTPDGGFTLNGWPYDLHGVCRHQDRQGRGWAFSDDDQDLDMALIDELGATAVRLTHYQQGQRFYELADRHGVILWSELSLVGAIGHRPAFTDNASQQLQELIRQNYNHPSVVVWGLANELVDFDAQAPFPLVATLNSLAHAEDPSRPTTLATHLPDAFAINGQTDVVGFNKHLGWYSGKFADLATWADGAHQAMPQRSLALSEYGAGASPLFHAAPATAPDHSEEYQAAFHEASWKIVAARPFLWAKFITFMFDAASDGRNEGSTPGRNDKGLVTYDRAVKKDAFYFYKATWSSRPFVYITSRRFEPRVSATTDVKVYSNLPEVTLTVNGQALNAVTAADHVFVWPAVTLQPGANLVEARAGDQRDAVTWTVADHGAPGAGPLSGPCTSLQNDGPAVTLMMGGTAPIMTGGPLIDGTYVLSEGHNAPRTIPAVRLKFRISDGGTRIQHIEGADAAPTRTAAGIVSTSENYLVRGFVCPGTTTLVDQYSATPDGLQILNIGGGFTTYTRQ
jgi:beta-galactosidase